MSEQILETPAETPAEQTTLASSPATTENSILGGQPGGEQLDLFPEEFRVMNGETLDVNATAAKLAEAYKARAAFGVIPDEQTDYNAPDGFDHWDEVKELEAVKQFQTDAKKLGFTNEQFAFAIKNIASAELDGRQYAQTANREESERQLREEWKDPNSYDLNIKQANNAVSALIPPAERGEFLQQYGSDAKIIKMLARIGGELSEDQATGLLESPITSEDVKSLMLSEAYSNSKHPQHAEVFAKVQRYYAKNFGTEPAL